MSEYDEKARLIIAKTADLDFTSGSRWDKEIDLIAKAIEEAVAAETERCANIVALANGPGRGEFIVPLVAAIRARKP